MAQASKLINGYIPIAGNAPSPDKVEWDQAFSLTKEELRSENSTADDGIIWIADERPSRADALKNRALLLETARALFREHGVEQVTMSAVADAAGVGKGTLYRHFPNKSQLCEALLDHDQRQLQARVLARLREVDGVPAPHNAEAARDALHWLLAEVYQFYGRNDALLLSEEALMGDHMLYHPAHYWIRITLRGLLTRIGATLDPDYAADTLYLMVEPRAIRFQHARGLGDMAILQHLCALVNRLTLVPETE